MRGSRRGFVMLDLVAGMAVTAAAIGLLGVLSVSMVEQMGRLQHAREIDTFATSALEAIIAGEKRSGAGSGELEVPEDWRQGEVQTSARIETAPATGDLVRLAVVVEEKRKGGITKVVRFETIVPGGSLEAGK
ncbi:MAG: hypothetical protein V2A58_13725 [Planctomycetota bacterium]